MNKLLSFEPWKKVGSRCRRLYRSENRPWSPFPFLGDKSGVWSDTDRSESGHQVVPRGCLAFRILINYRSTSCVDREPTRSIARSLAPIGTRINHPIHTRVTREENAAGDSSRPIIGHRRPGYSNFEYGHSNIITVSILVTSARKIARQKEISSRPDVGHIRDSSRGACKWLGLAPRLIGLINRFGSKREYEQSSPCMVTRSENEAFRV